MTTDKLVDLILFCQPSGQSPVKRITGHIETDTKATVSIDNMHGDDLEADSPTAFIVTNQDTQKTTIAGIPSEHVKKVYLLKYYEAQTSYEIFEIK